MNMGRYDQALADLDRAIELDPAEAWAIAARGQAYLALGRYDLALADLDRAIELDPDDAETVGNRGQACRRILAVRSAACDRDPDNPRQGLSRIVDGGVEATRRRECSAGHPARSAHLQAHDAARNRWQAVAAQMSVPTARAEIGTGTRRASGNPLRGRRSPWSAAP